MKKLRAFTLIELLVVVAIIGVLIAILVPSLGRVKESARRTTCVTQLKGQGMSFAIYAAQYDNALPAGNEPMGLGFDVPNNATWLHDESVKFCDTILGIQTSAGMDTNSVRKWFYCPSNPVYSLDQFWNTGINNKRSLGYASLRARDIKTDLPTNVSPSPRSPPLVYRKKWYPNFGASVTEVVEDLILTSTPPAPGISYAASTASTGAWVNSTSHMKGRVPAGNNILYLDGHAAWAPWVNTNKIHWVTCGGGPSGTVYFTMIDP